VGMISIVRIRVYRLQGVCLSGRGQRRGQPESLDFKGDFSWCGVWEMMLPGLTNDTSRGRV